MAGWRVGYVVVPQQLAGIMTNLQEALVSSVNSPAQWAAVAALTGPQDVVDVMRADYAACRRVSLAMCRAVGLPAHPPAGAFYLWVDISDSGLTSRQFAIELAEEARVTVAPGIAFGAEGEGHVRVSLAAQPATVQTGMDRLVEFWSRRAVSQLSG
jgi:aspartate/methionine/tyrosine aminotransferase